MEISSKTQLILFAGLLVFGLLNCVLGYRLLRFWVMIAGFMAGAAAGYFIIRRLNIEQKLYYLVTMIGLGIVVAIIAFLIYKAGVFLLAAALGMTAGIYFLRPTSSAMFFLCILIGVFLGAMGVRFSREVIIVATSLAGGAIAGLSLIKIGRLAEIPYGLFISAGFALFGMLVQFVINKPADEDDDDEDDLEENPVHSADSVDFRLPRGYDEPDDGAYDDEYEELVPDKDSGFERAPDLYDLKRKN